MQKTPLTIFTSKRAFFAHSYTLDVQVVAHPLPTCSQKNLQDLNTGLIIFAVQERILIVDDEIEMCLSLSEVLKSRGIDSVICNDPAKAGEILQRERISLILMDVRMPGIGGLDLLEQISGSYGDIPIIMISGYASVDNVVQAMKIGAQNFLEKPLDLKVLVDEINKYITINKEIEPPADKESVFLMTRNPIMEGVFQVVRRVAPTTAPVIVTGESGTGKEFIAGAIHQLSDRKDKPYIKLNCAAIPDNLLESELFGFEQGAFTDARSSKQGKFELANGGTIFFDEIGDMSLGIQAKLLRVLQEQEFEKLGGTETIQTDVRVICATNKDFKELIAQGKFRADLYYRISVINIQLPALKDRREDIPLLIDHYIKEYNHKYQRKVEKLSPEVESILYSHEWPGNIRELKNVLERSMIFCNCQCISVKDLPLIYQKDTAEAQNEDHAPLEELYDHLSRQMIQDALDQSDGCKQKAADLLRIHRKTLYNRMKKYGIHV